MESLSSTSMGSVRRQKSDGLTTATVVRHDEAERRGLQSQLTLGDSVVASHDVTRMTSRDVTVDVT